jgi:hypothetical protein
MALPECLSKQFCVVDMSPVPEDVYPKERVVVTEVSLEEASQYIKDNAAEGEAVYLAIWPMWLAAHV